MLPKSEAANPGPVYVREAQPAEAISTTALTRRFDERRAVDAIDLRIERGLFFGLIGSNGAGETTLIKMLTTLLPPSAGSARVAGFDVVRAAKQGWVVDVTVQIAALVLLVLLASHLYPTVAR